LKLARALLIAVSLSGCVIVPQNRRGKLADPLMTLHD